MEEYPEHWKNTLMGWDFWKDAQEYQEHLESELNSRNEKIDTSLHKRFPFNLGRERGPRTKEDYEKQEKSSHIRAVNPPHNADTSISTILSRHHPKFTMPDTKGAPGLRRNKSVNTVTSRIRGGLGLIRRARSPSPTRPAELRRPQTALVKDDHGVSYSWRELSSTPTKGEKQGKGSTFPSLIFDHSIPHLDLNTGLNESRSPEITTLGDNYAPLTPDLNLSPMPSPVKQRPRPLGRDITAAGSLRALKKALAEEQWEEGTGYPNWDIVQKSPDLRRDKKGTHPGDSGWGLTRSTSRLDLLAGMLDNRPSLETPELVPATGLSSPGFELSPLQSPVPSRSPGPRLTVPEKLNIPRNPGLATPVRPLLDFRGAENWPSLSPKKKTLGLDLFWKFNSDSSQSGYNCLDLVELRPLCEFRNLRSLKLIGMMQSYQSYIWQAAWLMIELDELELGMALEPDIVNRIYEPRWEVIDEGWTLDPRMGGAPVYFGNRGNGELAGDIGYGEYLDKECIEKAKIRAMAMGRTSHRLPIRKITLSGFVVDADPFIQWFDAKKLRCINFKGQCVDSGFWLSLSMKKVSVRFPRKIDYQPVPVGILKIDIKKDLIVVDLEKGKVIKRTSYSEFVGKEKPTGRLTE
ncbi:hypothetical protein N7456_006161 [Penicillium angulare]|uniref:Uncharacterized protein n=1 Tax=Penicillium angulare TaxID=116970 RepID=A0A9W9KKY9_9EURO|nr:hypothetical protein N7456_006161 [Penicillium angulare]